MFHSRKYRCSISILLITLVVVMLINGACGKKKSGTENGDIQLYFVDSSRTNLVTIAYEVKGGTTYEQVEEVIEQMNKKSKKINYLPAIPDSVQMSGFDVSDKILYMDFDENYLQMETVEELLCRAAIVLTMTQLYDIDYVSFTVNKQPLADSMGNPRGNMKAGDFIDNSGSNINSYQELKVVLYYANESGDGLVATNYSGLYAQNTSVEKFIIEKLIKGPSGSHTKRTLPSGLKLISVTTKDGICYVNFDSTFLDETIGVTPEVQLYSVVNSLSELSYVNKVQISINGETNKRFRDYVSLEQPFNRNLDIIKQ